MDAVLADTFCHHAKSVPPEIAMGVWGYFPHVVLDAWATEIPLLIVLSRFGVIQSKFFFPGNGKYLYHFTLSGGFRLLSMIIRRCSHITYLYIQLDYRGDVDWAYYLCIYYHSITSATTLLI